MANKLNYNCESILNIKFSPSQKGYDALEVDQTLDGIISDYKTLCNDLKNAASDNAKQKDEIEKLKEKLEAKEIEIANLKQKIASLPRTTGVNQDNYKLMRKVNAYERVLYRKGINPEKALSDPDNC